MCESRAGRGDSRYSLQTTVTVLSRCYHLHLGYIVNIFSKLLKSKKGLYLFIIQVPRVAGTSTSTGNCTHDKG